jgi:hypothetical protein
MSRRRTFALEKERKKERKKKEELECGFLRMEKNRRK